MGSLAERTGKGTDSMEVAALQHKLRLRYDGSCETFAIPETAGVLLLGAAEAQRDGWA
jgi:hypothetical protein